MPRERAPRPRSDRGPRGSIAARLFAVQLLCILLIAAALGERIIAQLAGSGFSSMIDATPIGLGRRPADVRRISESTGVHIVASTGFHRDAHYGEGHPLLALDVADRAALMRRELRRILEVPKLSKGTFEKASRGLL